MKVYTISTKQYVPISLSESWDFFSNPANLKKLTPGYMGFDIVSGADSSMFAGQIIIYKVRPLFNIPVTWVTEITHVEKHKFFVDEQRFGPYRLWHHKHHFAESGDGVEITDTVHYVLPFGILGRLFSPLTKRKLAQIFHFREQAIRQIFGN